MAKAFESGGAQTRESCICWPVTWARRTNVCPTVSSWQGSAVAASETDLNAKRMCAPLGSGTDPGRRGPRKLRPVQRMDGSGSSHLTCDADHRGRQLPTRFDRTEEATRNLGCPAGAPAMMDRQFEDPQACPGGSHLLVRKIDERRELSDGFLESSEPQRDPRLCRLEAPAPCGADAAPSTARRCRAAPPARCSDTGLQ
jgi:hypothetical protein